MKEKAIPTGGNLTAPELTGHVAVPKKWKSFLFHQDVLLLLLQSSNQDSLRKDEQAKKKHRPSSSHLSTPFGYNPDEEEPGDDLSMPRKVHYHSKWKLRQDAVYWINFA